MDNAKLVLLYVPALLFAVCWVEPALAQNIDSEAIEWVVFPNWSPGDRSGQGSSSELTVNASFDLLSGAFLSGTPFAMSNGLATNPVGSGQNTFTLLYEFVNLGGLPAEGIFQIGDLEPGSSIVFTGLVGGVETAVDWSVDIFEVNGLSVPLPTWNDATNTLFGNVTSSSAISTQARLQTDIALDAVRLDVVSGAGDGMVIRTGTVPIPEPTSLTLIFIGFLGMSMRHRSA
ncbi:MAG: hypothetical protein KF688_01200 [Pirellulales bacterium]|nr:hypothetical protein [Pirellulales bacterium]